MNRPSLSASQSNNWNRLKILSFALGLLSLTACQSVPATQTTGGVETRPYRTLTVSGKGDIKIPTTLTQVRLGVEVQGKTAQEVQQQVAQRSSAVVELLKSRKVDKLETAGISLNPLYSYKDGKQDLTGYTGSNIVSFRFDSQNAGTLLDDAVKAGATRIEGISFTASEEAIAQAQQQAFQEATDEAKKQAEAVLNHLKLTQREISNIQLNNTNPLPPYPVPVADGRLAQVARGVANTPVIGGEQQVEASVTLQFRY